MREKKITHPNIKVKLDGILHNHVGVDGGITLSDLTGAIFENVKPTAKLEKIVKNMLSAARRRFTSSGICIAPIRSTTYGDHGRIERVLAFRDYAALSLDDRNRLVSRLEIRRQVGIGVARSTQNEFQFAALLGLPEAVMTAIATGQPVSDAQVLLSRVTPALPLPSEPKGIINLEF